MKKPLTIFWLLVAFALGSFHFFQHVYTASHRMHSNDFKHIYLGSLILRHGGNPYDPALFFRLKEQLDFSAVNPFVYPPFCGLMLSPLTWFTFPNAATLWFILNHFFVLLSIWIIWKAARWPWETRDYVFVLLILALNFNFYRTLTAGQLNALWLLFLSFLFLTYERQKTVLFGLLLAWGILFRLTAGIFLLLLVLERRWRFLAMTLFMILLLLLLTLPFIGSDRWEAFFPVMRAMRYGSSTWAQFGEDFYRQPFNQSINSLMHHLFTINPHTTPWLNLKAGVANLLTYLCALAFVVLVIIRQRIAILPPGYPFLHFVFLSLLLPSLMWDHHLLVLILPMLVLYQDTKLAPWPRKLLFALSLALLLPPVAFSAPAFRHGPGILIMSLKLWGTLILFLLSLFPPSPLRKPPHPRTQKLNNSKTHALPTP